MVESREINVGGQMSRTVIVFAIMFGAAPVYAATLWAHNGSMLYLEADGGNRKFYYDQPRAGLPAKKGTLLFSGTILRNHLEGIAYAFSQKCGAIGYSVSGTLTKDESNITMWGKVPRRADNCATVGYRTDVLLFTLQPQDSSRSRLKKDPRAQYTLLKKAFEAENPPSPPKPYKGVYHLAYCAPASVHIRNSDEFTSELARLSYEVIKTYANLTSLGYPASIWGAMLSEYETKQLNEIIRTGKRSDQIASQLGDRVTAGIVNYRARVNPKLANVSEVAWQSHCGDYFVSVRVITRPPGGRVQFFPSMYGRFCEAQGFKATDFKECNQYDERSDGEEVSVSGAYIYRATWPDGKVAQGRRDFGADPTAKVWILEPSR